MEDVSSKISTQQQLISNKNQSSDKTSPKTLPNKVPVAVISPTKQEVKAPELYSPSCPISPESPEPIGDLPPPPPPKINQSPAKVGVGVSKTSEVENEKKLNPTQILNIAGLNPTQQSAAKDAIMSIAELSRQLQLGQILPNKETSHKEKDGLSPVSIDNIESSAVEMYNKGKQKTLLKKLTFQQEVVEAAKSAIKPHYERREINKTQYKDIMKRAVNKICQADKTKIVNPVKVRRLIRRYVECYQRKNVKSKEKMKNVLDLKVEKHMRPKISDPSESPPSPIGSPLTAPESASEDTSNTPSLLKREPRKIVTLPDLPLPPPPPPPRPRY
uniref:SFR19-like C-terminal domain-containing protein n=2 Tax=Ciona intestinalis TaxID=7719 RepID=F6SY99_CIOIN